MAFINYVTQDDIPPEDRVADRDNIIQIHGVHSRMLLLHFEMYRELMSSLGPLDRTRREMIGLVVSAENACHY